tara:strand:- start:2630 stop:3718 length:1089 start_codon:yes stop_codon:yes gene_type:complete
MINRHILELPAYNAGLPIARFRSLYGHAPRAKLDSNETPFGVSPRALTAGQAAVAQAHLYPDGNGTGLRDALAEATGVEAGCIVLGNGSEELIYALYGAVLGMGDHVLTVAPGFGLHTLAAQGLRIPVETVRYRADWTLPMAELKAALARKPKVFAISSPSNPLGVALTLSELHELLAATHNETLVLLDEAYFEYNPIDSLSALKASGLNWISLRTFSKAYGLAGMRVGYGLCSSAMLRDAVRKLTPPFNANAVAQAMGQAAFEDRAFLAETVQKTIAARDALAQTLRDMGFRLTPSKSNAVFFATSERAVDAAERLRGEGVLVKAWLEDGFDRFLRVSVGTPQDNKAFIEALTKLGVQPAA